MAFRKDPADSTGAPSAVAAAASAPAAVNPPDTHIWGVYFALVAFSIVELYSASSFEIAKQGLYAPLIRHVSMLGMGLLIILGLQRVHYRYFIPASRVLFWVSAAAMVYVMFFGDYINGARRAVTLPFMTLQPAEFIKLSAALMLALILSSTQFKKDPEVRRRGLIKSIALVLVLSLLLFTQGLTNTMIMMAISVAMFAIGAVEGRKFFYVMLVYLCFGVLAMGVKVIMSRTADDTPAEAPVLVDSRGNTYSIPEAAGGDRQTTRITDNTWDNRMKTFLDPTPKYERPINAKNLQEMRSYMAQANGGLFGVMPGNSRETSRLPLAFSDYIYAIIVEDWGLVGGLFIMVLYLWLLARAYIIARQCNQVYAAFLVTGCAVLITVQALCHMAIVSGAGPVSGQPLPLFSKGGTSILVTSIAFGVMLSVSRYSVRAPKAAGSQLRTEAEALPENLRAENPTQIDN